MCFNRINNKTGEKREDKCKPLLVSFGNEDNKETVMRRKANLKNSEHFKGVRIYDDLTLGQRNYVNGPDNKKVRIMALVKKNTPCSKIILRKDLMSPSLPSIWLESRDINQRKTLIGSVYREWRSQDGESVLYAMAGIPVGFRHEPDRLRSK